MSVLAPEREQTAFDHDDRTPQPRPRRRGFRRSRTTLRMVAYGVLALVLVLGLARLLDVFPGIGNPFTTERVDRSQPALLTAVEDLSEYHAATGHFNVILDLEEDTKYVPGFVKGERTLFVAAGTVNAVVDFSGMEKDAIEVSADGDAVTFTLPAPTLGKARVDPEKSYVFARERGLLDRVGDAFATSPGGDRDLYVAATEKLQGAAAESDLLETAEANTRAMLTAMARSLGYQHVTVTFEVVER